MAHTLTHEQRTHWRKWASIWLAAGALLRIIFIFFPRGADDDTDAYLEMGRNLLHHGTYGFMGDAGVVSPALFRLPGYPIFLALLGGRMHLIFTVQSVIDLAGCLLLALVVRRYCGIRAGLATLAVSATCFFTAIYAACALTESLSIFAVAAAIYCLGELLADSKFPGAPSQSALSIEVGSNLGSTLRRLLPLAACAALAVLLRPDGALVTISVSITLLVYGSRRAGLIPAIRTTFLFGILAILPLIPWTIRNEVTFHVFQPLAPRHVNDPGERVNFGFYRWLRTWAFDYETTCDVYWHVGTEPITLDHLPNRAFDSEAQRTQTAQLIAAYNIKNDIDQPLDDRFAALAQTRVQSHPLRYYLWVPLARVADMWLRPRTEGIEIDSTWWTFSDPLPSTAALALLLLNLAYILAAIAGAFRKPPIAIFLGAYVLLRCLLLSTMENAEPRYTLEAFPIIFVLAAIFIAGKKPQADSL